MNLYPWLTSYYKNIIGYYQNHLAHHALLLHAIEGMGQEKLVNMISKWLMCNNHAKGFTNCKKCHSCKLMIANTHPDYYILHTNTNVSLGIDIIRDVIEKLHHCAQQGGAKIVFIPNSLALTEAAVNALLKILEEPPNNCWFFLIVSDPMRLLATLRSRCKKLYLCPPSEVYSLKWLKKQLSYSDDEICSALRLSNYAPISAYNLLSSNNWKMRQVLYQTISTALDSDVMQLLPILNHNQVLDLLSWVISFLMDLMKAKLDIKEELVNIDYLESILTLEKKINYDILYNSTYQWIACRKHFLCIDNLHRELLLTNQLLNWEKLLTSSVN